MSDQSQSAAAGDGPVAGVDTAVLHMSPAERAERGVDDETVREAFLAVARHGDAADKDLRGVTLPALSVDRLQIDPDDRHPLDLREATVEAFSAEEALLGVPIRLDDATVGELSFDEATLHEDVRASNATFEGPVSTFETRFEDEVAFEAATFEGPVDLDEGEFRRDVTVDRATFHDDCTARAAEFYGDSNLLDDNTSFTGARFVGEANFRQTTFGYVHFEECVFEERARFEEALFDGDAEFTDAEFAAAADFDEITVEEDAAFDAVAFDGPTHFRGATFTGGQRTLEDDTTFAETTFADEALFEAARFRFATFADAHFESRVDFTDAAFDDDARFDRARFGGPAVFEEVRFRGDGRFADAVFEREAAFHGTEFAGGANRVEADAGFAGVRFETDAHFQSVTARTADFSDAAFGGEIDFTEAEFTDNVAFAPHGIDTDAYVDFTRAKLRSGHVHQPPDEWVRYDLTRASLGDVRLVADSADDERELLDYFRFCRTEFTEFDGHDFDFGAHRAYLERNDWSIHEFDEPPAADPEYSVAMTPETVATTYLKAKQAAREDGETKIAGEFRVKRQRFTRRENVSVVTDEETDVVTRVKNLGRAAENYLLGISCGHGMRPLRIGAAFLVSPLLFVPLYAFGGPTFATTVGQLSSLGALATESGRATFFELVHFSYVSYTTIGYGNNAPAGAMARVLATLEAYLSVVLSALFVYALVKRSEL
ncbi:potassium channel family protein [Halobaculum sp. MBLA0147]|uniref:potassium channel family protein n=1 Tax=Halobaculum sp. MBLA0147 TaxID=3079934 RepID=UPI003523A4FB